MGRKGHGHDAPALLGEKRIHVAEMREWRDRAFLPSGDQIGLVRDIVERRVVDRPPGQGEPDQEREPDREDDDQRDRLEEPRAERAAAECHGATSL